VAQTAACTHTLRSRTDEGAMQRAVALAKEAEKGGMLAVSILAGFGLADIPAPCISVIVVGNGDRQKADEVAERIAAQIWEEREGFTYRPDPLPTSIAMAAAAANATAEHRPVLLLDHGDNCMSGGTCDNMAVLHEALAQGLDGIAVGPVCDPEAVAQLIAAGVGASVTLNVGDKVAAPQLNVYPESKRYLARSPRSATGNTSSPARHIRASASGWAARCCSIPARQRSSSQKRRKSIGTLASSPISAWTLTPHGS
jgi:microcystin degradation protein MlrC